MQHSIHEAKLKNGAQGLIIRVPGVDVVRILVEFRAGYDLGDWAKFELPHVMEHMMFTNKSYPEPGQFSKEVEKNGAFNNAYTSSTSLEYDYECAAFEVERIANLIGVQIAEPTFPSDEFGNEVGNVIEELNGNLSNPMHSASYNLSVAQEGLPSIQDRIAQIDSMSTDDLHRWYRHTHTGANMRFIVAGDVDFEDKVLPFLDVDLSQGERLEVPPVASEPLEFPIVESREIPQIYYVARSNISSTYSYREMLAARLATNILSAGFTSTLLGKARQKGLVYGLGMGIDRDMNETGWGFRGMVTPEHAKDYFDLATDEISKVINGDVTTEQFQATKQLMRGNRALNYQKTSNFVNYYESFFTLGYNDFEDFDRIVDELTIEEVTSCFSRLFESSKPGMSFLGAVDETQAAEYGSRLQPIWGSSSTS